MCRSAPLARHSEGILHGPLARRFGRTDSRVAHPDMAVPKNRHLSPKLRPSLTSRPPSRPPRRQKSTGTASPWRGGSETATWASKSIEMLRVCRGDPGEPRDPPPPLDVRAGPRLEGQLPHAHVEDVRSGGPCAVSPCSCHAVATQRKQKNARASWSVRSRGSRGESRRLAGVPKLDSGHGTDLPRRSSSTCRGSSGRVHCRPCCREAGGTL